MGRENLGKAFGRLFLGVLGLGGLSSFFLSNCPVCEKPVKQGTSICPYCRVILEWH